MITYNQLKVGMKVKIRDDLQIGNEYGHYNMIVEKMKWVGKIVTIREIVLKDLHPKFYIAETSRNWNWTVEMIDYIVDDKIRILRNRVLGIKEEVRK